MKSRIFAAFIAFFLISNVAAAQTYQPRSLNLPAGYRAEVVEKNLAAPVMIAFDNKGRMLIAESGTAGRGATQVVRIENNGNRTVLADVTDLGNQLPLTAMAYHDDKIFIAHGGTISVLEQDGKVYRDLITGLPGNGDYPIGQLAFQGAVMYFTIGTVTNSGVVAKDDISNTWLNNDQLAKQHDIPCQDIQLTRELFNKTSPYSELGKSQPGAKISGNVKCNGALLRANTDGSRLQVYAWGFRNPYDLQMGPDNNFYILNQGIQDRGARPFAKGTDCIYKLTEGQWYGWPDFDCGTALPKPVIAKHPVAKPAEPVAKLDINSGAAGFGFAPSNDWGKTTDVFVALSENKKIVRVDTTNGEVNDFITGGFDVPVDVEFSSDGAMYVIDAGIPNSSNSGAIWRISRVNQANPQRSINDRYGLGPVMSLAQIIILGLLTIWFGKDEEQLAREPRRGVRYGLIAAAGTLVFMLLLTLVLFKTRWYAPIQLFNLIKINHDALTFHVISLILGLVVFFGIFALFGYIFARILKTRNLFKVAAASALYGLTIWALMQYLILPHYSATVIQRSFPPSGFTMIFLFFALALGYLFSQDQLKKL